MAKRIDFRKATEDRIMRARGTERLDDTPLAEQSAQNYRRTMNEPLGHPEGFAASPHQKIVPLVLNDIGGRENEEWPLISKSEQRKGQAAKRLQIQQRLTAKQSKGRPRKKSR